MREDLNQRAERRIAVLDPVKLIIDNYPDGQEDECQAPNHPQKPELGHRMLPFSRELWIERNDFTENPPKGYFRLSPGAEVRLRYGWVIQCVGVDKDAQGNVIAVHCTYDPDTRSGTPGANQRKVKGNIHWLSTRHALQAEVRLYDRLFTVPQPDAANRDYKEFLNPDSKHSIHAYIEPALAQAQPEERFQFERHGYFVADLKDTAAGRPVFNRTVTLRDSWGKATA
jgi:glutaminyl-tRNA synthetase